MSNHGIRGKPFWRKVLLELLGTTLFVFLVTAVLTGPDGDVVQISFAIGLAIAILAHVFGPISGGHFNPAITLGTLITSDVDVLLGIFYFIAQMVGGIAGSALTFGLTSSKTRDKIDGLRLGAGLNVAQGFIMELLLTALLVFAFLASSSNDNNRQSLGFTNPLAVGISITVAHLVGIPYTGSGINPARAFGPSLIVGQWQTYHWMYWLAPLCGGALAALIYRFIIKVDLGGRGLDTMNERTPLTSSTH